MRWPASILVPLLRQDDRYLEQAIRSACDQTVPCEVIVTRAAETPASNLAVLDRLAARYPQLVVIEVGLGLACGLNDAIRAARGDRVGFLMSDDWLEPGTLAACLPVDADIVSTGITAYLADGSTELTAAHCSPSYEGFAAQQGFAAQASYLKHFLLLRRSRVLEAGGLDESLDAAAGCGVDDFDLIWTLLERGATVGIVPDRLYNYRDHPGERLTLQARSRSLAALREILDKHGLTGRERLRTLIAHGFWQGKTLEEGFRQLRDRDNGRA